MALLLSGVFIELEYFYQPLDTLLRQHQFGLVPAESRLAPLTSTGDPCLEVVDCLTGFGEGE